MGRWMVPLALLLLPVLASSSPKFTKPAYNATIYENSRGKTYVSCPDKMGIRLEDEEPIDVRYKIVGGDRDKFFKAEEKAVGDFVFLMIRTRTGNTDVLNRERKDKYTLHIKATLTKRGVKPFDVDTTLYVSILDRNDLNPLFYPNAYDIEVAEDARLHQSIIKVNAEDADLGKNGQLYFYFNEKTEQFSIQPMSGIITITRRLRYAEKSVHHLTVVAKDRGGGKPSYGKVTIRVRQVNLFGPEIYVHTLPSVVENAKASVFAIVRVLDQDEGVHGQIKSLEIVDGDPDGNFNVRPIKYDVKTGYEYNIELLNSLDRESSPKGFNLTLRAVDNGSPSRYTYKSVPVLLSDMNDNPPVFDRDFYEVDISENTPPNSPIVRAKITDSDLGENGMANFEILSNDADGKFTINPTTGMIYTDSWLDAEKKSFYSLTVSAIDRAYVGTRKQSSVSVKINVIDANDNDPVFETSEMTLYVNENEPAGTSVAVITAKDDDSGENSYISYSIANLKSVPFEIDHFSGLVKTTQVLDYESSKRNFILKIRASDWGMPYRRQTEMQLKIIVRDVNDNRPQFEKVDCVGHIPKTAPIGTELLTLSALDFDAGSIISYRILSGNEDDCFYLDSTTGILTTTCDLSDLKVTQRELNVTATDTLHFADMSTIIIKLMPSKKNLSLDPKLWFKCQDTGVARRLTEVMASAEKNNVDIEEFAMMPSRYGQNAHNPEFIDFPVQVVVNESVSIGTTLVSIKASDRDLGYNGKLVFGVTSGDTDSVFRIDPDTGDLKVVGFLDREREDEYLLNITVYDLGKPKKSTSRFLPISVIDVNDNAPKFDKPITSFRVTENAVNNTAIYTVNASDADFGENARISFSIVSDSKGFRIDSKTGVLYVDGVLDREEKSYHQVTIRATDCADTHRRHALFSDSLVKIFVDDLNDNPPKFSSDKFKVMIPEDIPIGVVVAIISAIDPDLGEGGTITYSLPDDSDTFEIDNLTGTVRTIKSLDYETVQTYILTVQAEDNGVPSLTSTTIFTVEVIDVNENDHAPYFPETVISAKIEEGKPVNSLVTTAAATDADPPGRDSLLSYRLVSGDGLGYFWIDNQGEIRTKRILDAETKRSYWLTVVCEDSGVVPLHSLLHVYIEVIDVNDNIPMSVKPIYEAWVLEESSEVVSVIQVLGTDADLKKSTLSYSIKNGNPIGHFSINQTSGLIKTTGIKFDREDKDEHVLEVEIKDDVEPKLSSTVKVIVKVKDVNDNDPAFDQSHFQVTVPEVKFSGALLNQDDESFEEEPVTDEVFGTWENFPEHPGHGVELFRVIASDKDVGSNGALNFSMNAGKGRGRFTINPTTGMIYAQKPLLRGHLYNLKVMASDNGKTKRNSTSRVTIKVVGIPSSSTHSPVFKVADQTVVLMESDDIGYLVCLAQATDSDSHTLYYNISAGNELNNFAIGRDKGDVVIAKKLDKEYRSNFNLTLSVTDGVHTAYTRVKIISKSQLFINILDVNEHSPKFSSNEYVLEVCECTPKGTVVLQLNASDADFSSKLIFSIFNSQNEESLKLFTLNYETGALSVSGALDRESMAFHMLTVLVSDGGTPTRRDFARIQINITDVNDHMPEFSVDVLETRIYSTSPIGTKVATIIGTDMDAMENGTVSYSILSGNDGGKFSIDPILGDLTLVKPLDSNNPFQYTLIVKAEDSGPEKLHNTLPVHIFISIPGDIPPRFQYKELSAEIYENSLSGSFVIQLEAHGWGLTFEIIEGNDESAFKINPTTGTITTNYLLDREEKESYNLTIAAFNMVGGKNTCKIYIYILDQNDNAPSFSKTHWNAWILESADVGSFIMDSEGKPLIPYATDKDRHVNALLNYQFLYRNISSMFHIDPNTGAVRTVVCLDYEKTPNITLSLIVTDKGVPRLTSETTATIFLSVIDVNDSPPLFTRSQYNVTMLLPTFEDVTVIQLNATDADSKSLTSLKYSIIDGNKNGLCAINSSTGLITVKDKTKATLSSQRLKVVVTDGKYRTEAIVYINWVPIPNNYQKGLIFQKSGYLGAVLENSTQILTVVVVSVSGTDLNEHIAFSILNPTPEFSIGEISGAIRTTGIPLDREKKEFYMFIVQAESQLTKRVSRTEVNITVLDINDNCPIVLNTQATAVVSVSSRKHHFVAKVVAFDADKEENGEIHYELERYSEFFKICPKSGNVTLRQQLPSHVKEYNLLLNIRDNGIPPCSNKMKLDIIVLDEETPVFEKRNYECSVPENIPLHTPIPLNIRTLSPTYNDVIYSIEEGDIYEEFYASFDAGSNSGSSPCVIKVQSKLDYEETQKYTLKIRATDAVTRKYSEVFLTILVTDVNDNAPTFEMGVYNISVMETLPVGGLVTQIEAKDNDTGTAGVVRYIIDTDQSESGSYFHIRSETGEVFLKKSLNYEFKKKHQFVVKAIDAGSPPLTSSLRVMINVIDVLDTSPQILLPIEGQLYGSDATRGQFVSFVRAYHDTNGTALKYAVLGYNHAFHMDKDNGVVIIANPKNISTHDFSLNVSVSDGVYTTTSHLDIYVTPYNQHSPHFEKLIHEVAIKENMSAGSHVVTLHAEDYDIPTFAKIQYEIPSQEMLRVFSINKNSGEIKTKIPLDKETRSYYEFIVLAIDSGKRTGFTTVCITILDSNDNPPKFSSPSYYSTIFANTTVNTPFLTVHASDIDDSTTRSLSYSILSNRKHDGLFSIDATSGEISLINPFESKNDAAFQLFVRATDTGNPSLYSDVPVTIIVTSNPFPLYFPKEKSYTFFASEAAVAGSIITVLNTESEVGVKFKILGPESNIFEVNKAGQVSIKASLDREKAPLHRLTILCETVTNPSFSFTYHITLHVLDVNDNKPIFESDEYTAYVVEGTAEGTPVMKVTANDADEGKNGEIHYWLEDGLGNFILDQSSGWILTQAPLDWESQIEQTLTIVAFDSGNPALSEKCKVNIKVIDTNDNPPVFLKSMWNISVAEDVALGTSLLTLETSDADSAKVPLKFFIVAGDSDCYFNINSSGILFLTRSLDRENLDNYLLTVLATDGKFTALTKVAVEVTDVNDEKPQCPEPVYKVQVPEDIPRNSFIATIDAFDLDIEQKFKFFLKGEHSEYFSLNNLTGELKTRKMLDREKTPEYHLMVDVVDDEKNIKTWKCQSEVFISVFDVNDSPPRFSMSNLSATILENAKVGSMVTQVHATDDDLGVNAKLRYSMSSSDTFTISSKTGLIQLTKSLDREVQDKYILTVTVYDQGIPKLSTTSTMIINVLDVNDNPPIFTKKLYSVKVPENVQLNTEIIKLEAYSADVGLNAEMFYSIANGNDDGRFSLDSKSGILSVVQPLDFELVKSYLLTVEAVDKGEPPLSSQALVNITVIDANDNIPIFVQVIYSTSVYENVNPGNTILQVLATDVDSGENGKIIYSLEKGDSSQQFSVDPVNGYITISKPLDREKISSYKLSVKATDLGKPPLSTAVSVNIEVLDINDNPPLFSKSNFSAVIQEGKAAGWSITRLNVSDADAGHNGAPYRFDIIEGNQEKLFKINNDGTIRTMEKLKHSVQHVYHLKVRVFDNGVPPLFSDTSVTIKVVEESQYAPSLISKDIHVFSYEDNLKKSSLGYIHAQDPDEYDTLMYTLNTDMNGFNIDPLSGELTAYNLDTGQYKLNVTVSDGKFSSNGYININIQPLYPEMLLSSFSFRIKGMNAKNFILTGRKSILHMLKKILKTEIFLLSVQPVNKDVDVLLSFQENISLDEFNGALLNCGLPSSVLKCECQNGGICRQRLSIIQQKMIVTSSESFSFVAPAHSHRMYCACLSSYSGDSCEVNLDKDCDCPPPTVCSHQGGTRGYFVCASPPPVAPLCAENHTCNSSSQSSTDQFTFSHTYIIVVIIAFLVICILAASSVVFWKYRKRRNENDDNSKKVSIDAETLCHSKINNLKISQTRDRPSSYNCGNDSLYSALPLNNLDSIRAASGEEIDTSSCSFVQNLTKSNDNLKINNGYQREQSDKPRPKVVTFLTDKLDDLDSPGPSPRSPRIIIKDTTVQLNDDDSENRTSDYTVSYGFPNQRNTLQRIRGIEEAEIIS